MLVVKLHVASNCANVACFGLNKLNYWSKKTYDSVFIYYF